MRIAALLALGSALPGFAQYHDDLATTRDGSVLYFSYTSPSLAPSTRIYRWSQDAGVTLFGDRPDLAALPPLFGQHLYGTQLTDDGSVLYHAEPLCATGTGPGFNTCTTGETQIVTPGLTPFTEAAFLLISPNGRYGVFTPFSNGGLWVDWWTGEQLQVDFHGMIVPQVTPPFSVNQHAVANNGSFLIQAAGSPGLRIWSKDGETVIPLPDYIQNAAISADGSTVSVTAHDPSQGYVSALYDVRSGRRTPVPQPASLSEDGATIAWLSTDPFPPQANPQAMVSHSDGTGARQVTNAGHGVRSVLISPDAHYLYVVVNGADFAAPSRIQRFDLVTGDVVEIPPVE